MSDIQQSFFAFLQGSPVPAPSSPAPSLVPVVTSPGRRTSQTAKQMALILPVLSNDERTALATQFDAYVDAARAQQKSFGPDHLVSVTCTITPKMATFLLSERNHNNRPVSYTRVQRYCRIIEDGHWIVCSQGLSIATDGTLNNGQHRLWSVIIKNDPQKFFVVFGESKEAKSVLDTAQARTAGHVLAFNNIPHATNMAATARCLRIAQSTTPHGIMHIDNQTIHDIVASNPEMQASINCALRIVASIPKNSIAGIALAHYLISKSSVRSQPDIEFFFDFFRSGTGITDERATPFMLRRQMVKRLLDCDGANKGVYTAACMINAWNCWATNKKGLWQWKKDAPFPTPV